jgi:hypothetical protein
MLYYCVTKLERQLPGRRTKNLNLEGYDMDIYCQKYGETEFFFAKEMGEDRNE